MAKLLRPSARQMRSDFEQRAFSGLNGSGTLAGLGIGGRPKKQDDRSAVELKKRVAMQEEAIGDLQREIVDARLSSEVLQREHASIQAFVQALSSGEAATRTAALADYVEAAEMAASSLSAEISQGREAVANLRRVAAHEEADVKFFLAMIGNFRGRILAGIPSPAGVLCVPETLPNRKFLGDRKFRPPPMSPVREKPERRMLTSRKVEMLADALAPCFWLRRQQRVQMCRSFFDRLAAENCRTRRPEVLTAPRTAPAGCRPGTTVGSRPEDKGLRPGTTVGSRQLPRDALFSHTASFFAAAMARRSPYAQTLKTGR